MFKCVIPAMVGLVLAPRAQAQDASAFQGAHAEAVVGWSQLRFDLSNLNGGAGRGHPSDIAYGGAAGYDVAVSPTLVAGVEAAVQGSDASLSAGTALNGGFLRARREIDLTRRLGVAVTPGTLLYAKLGYGNLQVRDVRTTAGVTSSKIRDIDGLLAGAGVEVKMSPRTYLKTEYRYGNYADNYASNQVMTGIGLRF